MPLSSVLLFFVVKLFSQRHESSRAKGELAHLFNFALNEIAVKELLTHLSPVDLPPRPG